MIKGKYLACGSGPGGTKRQEGMAAGQNGLLGRLKGKVRSLLGLVVDCTQISKESQVLNGQKDHSCPSELPGTSIP